MSREAAPIDALRRWFGHLPERWQEFRRRYREELGRNAALDRLLELAAERRVTWCPPLATGNATTLSCSMSSSRRDSAPPRGHDDGAATSMPCERPVHDDRLKRDP
jgi:hypothetical protein